MIEEKWDRTKIVQWVAWLAYGVLLLFMVMQLSSPKIAFIRVAGILAIQASLFYVNLNYLLPNLYENKRYLAYAGASGLMLVAAALDAELVEWGLRKTFPNDTFFYSHFERNAPPKAIRVVGRVIVMLGPFILSSLLRSSILLRKRNEEQQELQHRVLEAETSALRSQINPHFLFNTLNNIYTLSELQSEKTGEAVLQLSDMLRYVIYESNHKFVPLQDEITYIRSYIQLQLLKDEGIENVRFSLPEADQTVRIAPMLLIPFIENSFKHSKFEDLEKGWIDIRLNLQGNHLVLEVENSVPEQPFQKDRVGGVGLENVRQRLQLIYPEAHQLEVVEAAGSYLVTLKIHLTLHT